MKGKKGCLLIGNSRWHWAIENNKQWQYFHLSPQQSKLNKPEIDFFRWAAVGHIPNTSFLKPSEKITTINIPINENVPWLGIDRALAAWGALQRKNFSENNPNGIWIVDAGTILSITRITDKAEFVGGQLIPGLSLQLSSMASAAINLKNPSILKIPKDIFPIKTEEAMLRGAMHGILGVIIEAYNKDKVPIWLCGGNASIIYQDLIDRKIPVINYSNLVLEGMTHIINLIKK